MAPASQTRKIALSLTVLIMFLSTVSSAEINLEDDTVWLNEDQKELEVNISNNTAKDYNLSLEQETEIDYWSNLSNDTSEVSTSEFSAVNPDLGSHYLILNSSQVEDNKTIYIEKLSTEIKDDGSGFVGKKLGGIDGTDSLRFELDLKDNKISKDNLGGWEISSSKAEIDSGNIDVFKENGVLKVVAQPDILEKLRTGQDLTLLFDYSLDDSTVEKSLDFSPTVYELRAVPSGDRPPIELEYGNIEDYSYNLDIFQEGNDVSSTDVRLFDQNFTLDITGVGNTDFEGDDEDLLDIKTIDNVNADYRATLKKIPQLGPGTYRFTLYLEDDEGKVYVDDIRVSNSLKLSGRVQDSGSSSVQARFNLRNGDTQIPIETDSTGNYYKEISSDKKLEGYQVEMEFFDLASLGDSSDGTVTAEGVDFEAGEQENIAGDQESIKFQYWQNPPIDEEAISPINMMAVKFAYPMSKTGHFASMKFNPANVNTDELVVYSCSYWNFEGRNCLGEWSQITDIDIDYQGSRVNFNVDDPYLAENTGEGDQNILMNAYVVGTSADLSLPNDISIRSSSVRSVSDGVPTGSEITVEGRIFSENDNPIEGAEVEIGFYQGDKEVSTLETDTTNIEGRFKVSGQAPEDSGNYSVKVTAEKRNYNTYEEKFDNRFETYIKEGIAINTDKTVSISAGEEKTVDVNVENTGQTLMENIELAFSGVNSDFYTVSDTGLDQIESDGEKTVEVTFDFPSDYFRESWPTLEISATAENVDGEKYSAENSLQTQISIGSTGTGTGNGNEGEGSETEESTTENNTNSLTGSFSESVSGLETATGDFLASQSTLNLALGLIMVLVMAVAGAVKKNRDGDRESRGGGKGRMAKVQRPDVSGGSEVKQVSPQKSDDRVEDEDSEVDEVIDRIEDSEVKDVDDQIEEIAGTVSEYDESFDLDDSEDDGSREESGSVKCSTCGEEFDTASGRKLHEEVMH